MKALETIVDGVEEILYDMQDEIDETADIYQIPVEGDEEAQIEITGIRILIPELKYSARFGEYLIYDEDEEEYFADFSLTLVYNLEETDPANHLYWEQDGLAVTLYNFSREIGKPTDMQSILEMECEVIIEAVDANN